MPRTLAQNAQYIAETIKPAIKSAIEAQGVTVPSTDSFLDYADRIGEIEGGGSGYQLKDLPTGSISTVNDAEPLPLNALKVSVEAVQEGTGDPSPSNIRPIHGWDSGEITVDGKNLMQNNMTADTDYNGVLWHKNTDGSITVSGIPTGNSYVLNALKAYIKDLAQIYIISGLADVTNILWEYVRLYDIDDNLLEVIGVQSANDVIIDYLQSYPLTAYITINPKRISNGVECSGTIKPQLEIGTRATSFEPYQTETITLDFPQTIYGAEWDVVGGSGIEKHKQVDLGTINWGAWGTNAFYTTLIPTQNLPETIANDLCESYKCYKYNDMASVDYGFCHYTAGGVSYLVFKNKDINSPADFKTSVDGIVLSYETIESEYIPIQLSPLSIRLRQGVNNVFADCGEVIEGEYFVDEGAIDVRKVDYQIGSSGSIKTTDGRVLSGFASMSGYHARPLDASGNWLDVDWSKDFEIGVAFKFTALPSYQSIFGDGNANSYRKAPRIYYDNSEGKLALCVSSDGSTLAIDTYLNYTFAVDKWYFIKAKFVSSTMTFTVDISDDFSTFTSLYSGVMASAPYHDTASLSLGGEAQQSNMASNTFLIDTFNAYIKGDGVSWGASTGVFPS